MSNNQLRLSCEDFEDDGSPEILMEIFTDGELSYAVYAFSSNKDGTYDKSSSPTDLDGDGDMDEQDTELFLVMANVFAKTCKNSNKK